MVSEWLNEKKVEEEEDGGEIFMVVCEGKKWYEDARRKGLRP